MPVSPSYCSGDADAPVVVDPIIAAESKEAAVEEERIVVQVTMPDAELQIRDRLNDHVRVHFGEALVERRDLRIDHERSPRHRREAKPVKEVRVLRLVERIVEIHIDVGFELEPADRQIVAPGLQPVAHADAPDRPVVDGIDGGELRKIDRRQLGRGLEAIELQNGEPDQDCRCPRPRKN